MRESDIFLFAGCVTDDTVIYVMSGSRDSKYKQAKVTEKKRV